MGYIISKEGIYVDVKNIEDPMNWPTLKYVIDLRFVMGLVGYYRIFNERFLKVSHPINSFCNRNG